MPLCPKRQNITNDQISSLWIMVVLQMQSILRNEIWWEKNDGFVFSVAECLGLAVISNMFYALQWKQRCSGSQAHNGTGLSAVSCIVLHWKHPLCFTGRWSNMCLACKRSMSVGVITTTENTGGGWEVMHFLHWSASIHLSQRVWIGF